MSPELLSPELLARIHPDIRLRRGELPNRENAYSFWVEAASHLSPFEVKDYDEFETRACCLQQDLGYWLPEGVIRRELRDQIERNRLALETANLGVSLGRFQFPEPRGPKHFPEDTKLDNFIWQLTRIRNFKARLHVSCGEFVQAARELTYSLRMAEMALHGDGIVVTYLSSIAFQGSALDSMRGLARLAGTPADAIAAMLASIHRDWRGAEALAQCLRTEFHYYFLEQLAALCACGSAETLVDALLESVYDEYSLVLTANSRGPHPDGRSAWRRQKLLELLAAHPSPFDPRQTISAASSKVAENLRHGESCWRAERERFTENRPLSDDCWPPQLHPDFGYEILGPGPEARKAVEENLESMREIDYPASKLADLARYWQAPDEAAFAAARDKLRQIDNPVGLLLAERETRLLPTCVTVLFRARTSREATKAVLAIRLFLIQRGRLPESLDVLVDAGLLSKVPNDPFADRPLRYSRERAVVWSVGQDGAGDGADPPAEMVWSVAAA
ncbi:MAG TPA: hypothetical protein VGN42_24055 [Pirellulales bacterium]|jgi:hypothetical protein|nr:hypothetical protein [Pirellulales bacterium]